MKLRKYKILVVDDDPFVRSMLAGILESGGHSVLMAENGPDALMKFNREPAMPQINIVLPKTDAIIIYRALPVKPKMVLVM